MMRYKNLVDSFNYSQDKIRKIYLQHYWSWFC